MVGWLYDGYMYVRYADGQDSIVGIVTRLWAGWLRNFGLICGRAKRFFSPFRMFRLALGLNSLFLFLLLDGFLGFLS